MANSGDITKKPFPFGQMEALAALCDTYLPSLDDHHQSDDVIQYYQTSASMAGTQNHVAELLQEKVKHPKINLAKLAIRMLSTWIGTFVLCGRKSLSPKFPYFQRFSKVSLEKREEILLSWSTSYFSLLRIFFTALKIFTLLVFFTQVNDKNENISWKAIGYCGPDPARKPNPKEHQEKEDNTATQEELFGPLHKGIINLSQNHKQASLDKLEALGFPISTPHSKNTKIDSFQNPSFIIKCDAVVVGSGSGGGLAAGVLAKAGHKVLVLEKGTYMARNNLSLLEGQSMDKMYFNNGLSSTDEMDVMVVAGSTVGGGSTVNWSASIRTPPHVTKEWSEELGLKLFDADSGKYEHALDVVCGKMGVQPGFEDEGFNNMVLRKGCKKLGYDVENIPRNAPKDHDCGWCCFGCAQGNKKGTSETWLVDLVESGNGAILTECEALKVITGKKNGAWRKRAVGVAFEFRTERGREIGIVEAKVTVVACGAIGTPALLKRSGLRNPNIGRNLHLHPVVMAWGYFPEDVWPEAGKRSYEGGIMTAMSKVDDESGYGAVIQTRLCTRGCSPCSHLGFRAGI
ncbi:hypothetical protein CASFOL_036684 [Castilleja foliolosa]|uniref:Long-chain-alcohol oxidase n=1 Tax=Castilleja foliolosa TaxID=1961234 RepID=A0ABD3BPI6_9LAMI